MKKIYVEDIKDKERVESPFLITKKDSGVSKANKTYLILKLQDKTGEMDARVWDRAEEMATTFDKGDVVIVKGSGNEYQSSVQLNVSSIIPLSDGDYDLRDFMPASVRPPEDMMLDLETIIAGMDDKYLRTLLQTILSDGEVRPKFMLAPAATGIHHAFLGGLLEHVLSLAGLGLNVCKHYPQLNKDLLLTGVVLHDICKIYELSYDRGFDYTDIGKLLGHIGMEGEFIANYINKIKGFPDELKVAVQHMILSHHGRLEFGSPKLPMIMEAMVLSYIDDLDSKINLVETNIKATSSDQNWTSYIRAMERPFYAGVVPFTPDSKNAEVADNATSASSTKTDRPDKTDNNSSGNDKEPSLFNE